MQDLIGIPYLDKGREIETGLDCWGLFRIFYQRYMGIDLPSYGSAYEHAYDHVAMVKTMEDNWPSTWVRVLEPGFGDGIRLRIDGNACHVGVYLGHGQMLHTQTGHDSAIDRIDGIRWKNRIEGFYRHISIAGSAQ